MVCKYYLKEVKKEKKEGLGILNGNIEMLKSSKQFKVPHVGFSPIKIFKKKGIFKNIENDLSFYFTNSFCLKYKKKLNLIIIVIQNIVKTFTV